MISNFADYFSTSSRTNFRWHCMVLKCSCASSMSNWGTCLTDFDTPMAFAHACRRITVLYICVMLYMPHVHCALAVIVGYNTKIPIIVPRPISSLNESWNGWGCCKRIWQGAGISWPGPEISWLLGTGFRAPAATMSSLPAQLLWSAHLRPGILKG
jgi:hypothetical protein